MSKETQPTNSEALERGQYAKHLGELCDRIEKLGLPMPTDKVRVILGTEEECRPLGSDLPIYPESEIDTSEEGTKKALFNLQSLTGWR